MLDILNEGKKVFDIEIEALKKTRDELDQIFVDILNLVISCNGKVRLTGMGKPGHVATKIAATFSSLGISSFYLHPAEAMHGDLGMISREDIIIAISYSRESNEIINIIPNIKIIGAKLIGITANKMSSLAKMSDIVQILPGFNEACYLGLAPTASTTVELCYGDALAVVASGLRGFTDSDFRKLHPAGSLGKRLILKVEDLMIKDAGNSIIAESAALRDAIIELSQKGLGIVSVCNDKGFLLGVITDGDLRRLLSKNIDVYSLKAKDVMTTNPHWIESGALAVNALEQLKKLNISAMPVLKDGCIIGTIRLHDIIGIGIVG